VFWVMGAQVAARPPSALTVVMAPVEVSRGSGEGREAIGRVE